MHKKDFWKGFILAGVLIIGLNALFSTSFVRNLIPWNILPFEVNMSFTNKMNYIEDYLKKYYVDSLDEQKIEDSTFAGMTSGVGDRYTYYLPKDYMKQYLQNNNGHFEGIGVQVYQNENGRIIIDSVINDTPAKKAGLKALDEITKINDKNIDSLTLTQVVEKMKGPINSKVKIGVYRKSDNKNIDFEITRGDVVVSSVFSQMLNDETGYIKISGFKENTYDQFMSGLRDLQSSGIKSLILDLRNNPGGLVRSVYRIGDELLPQGLMVYTLDKNNKREELICDDKYLDIPLVILVNGNSASASEILAGAAKDTKRATIVGEQTFGKGLVQRLFTLPDGSGLNITIQKYFTPNGISIHGTGIKPDIIVSLEKELDELEVFNAEEDLQLQKALEVLK